MTAEIITALITLTAMEVILGIDNLIFISIITESTQGVDRSRIRTTGILLAFVFRLGLLLSIVWVMRLTEPFFAVMGHDFSGRDLILLGGGLFLLTKSTFEIHSNVSGDKHSDSLSKNAGKLLLLQIIALDLVFSLDSVITAVGMANHIWVMITAMSVAMVIMLVSIKPLGKFVADHPTIKILALSFLMLIGVMLVAEGMGQHIQKGYIYFAMFFSLFVEFLNMRYRKKH